MKIAEFQYNHELGAWIARDKAIMAVMSKVYITDDKDFLCMRGYGYVPVDVETGKELGRVDVTV